MTAAGIVTTVAGALNSPGASDGPAQVARFLYPNELAFDSRGNFYVSDGGNALIRRMNLAGQVDTVVGQLNRWGVRLGVPGSINTSFGLAILPGDRLAIVTEQALVGN